MFGTTNALFQETSIAMGNYGLSSGRERVEGPSGHFNCPKCNTRDVECASYRITEAVTFLGMPVLPMNNTELMVK